MTDNLRLTIVDASCQELFEVLDLYYIKLAKGLIIVYDVTNRKTFIDINKWFDKITSYHDLKDIPIIIIGNKSDLKTARKITIEEGLLLADQHNIRYFETSGITGKGINEALTSIIISVYNRFNN